MTIKAILDFWFGSDPDDSVVAKEKSALWWSKNSEIDGEIRQRFESSVICAAEGELSDWQTNPRGRLALILLTDQFPRNIYRDSPRAFAHDSKAVAWSLDGIEQGLDLQAPADRKSIFLSSARTRRIARASGTVGQIFRRAILDSSVAEHKSIFEEYLNFAVRHRDIIARFGRFPHRNKILGRESTADELAFLAGPGSSF